MLVYFYVVLMRKCLLDIMFSLSFYFFRVLRDNPLICSCDLHWLQQWQLTDRGDVNSQMLSCLSGDQYVPLSTLIIDNCSELVSHIFIRSQCASSWSLG